MGSAPLDSCAPLSLLLSTAGHRAGGFFLTSRTNSQSGVGLEAVPLKLCVLRQDAQNAGRPVKCRLFETLSALGVFFEKQRLTDLRFHHIDGVRFGDEINRLGFRTREHPFREGGDEYDGHPYPVEDIIDGIDARTVVSQLDIREHDTRRPLFCRLDGLCPCARNRRHFMTEIFRQTLYILGDQCVILDDENARRDAAGDFRVGSLYQLLYLGRFDFQNFRDVIVGKILQRGKQEGLAGVGWDRPQSSVGGRGRIIKGLRLIRSSPQSCECPIQRDLRIGIDGGPFFVAGQVFDRIGNVTVTAFLATRQCSGIPSQEGQVCSDLIGK